MYFTNTHREIYDDKVEECRISEIELFGFI